MTIKAEVQKKSNGIIEFKFRGNDISEDENLDAIRTLIMGDHIKRGGYVDSLTLVIEVNPNHTESIKTE